MLAALAQRRAIEAPVALVTAHPDDETIAAGGSMHLMRRLLLVQVTDGAPHGTDASGRAGLPTREAYAAARARELDRALALSGATPERAALGVTDQEASDAIPAIASALRDLFQAHQVRFVLTHAYEGGHPDHDSVALAVHLAAGSAEVFEFPAYHAGKGGTMEAYSFLPGPAETVVTLPAHDSARKRAMLDSFQTQAAILSFFDTKQERFRPVPEHDFTEPPHPGQLLYEHWGWSMTGTEWRRRAAAALRCQCAD